MGSQWRPVLVGLLLAVLVLAISDAVVLHALRGPAASFDQTVRMDVHALASAPLTIAMRILTWLGATITLVVAGFAAAAVLWRRGLRQRACIPPLALALACALTQIAKHVVRRPRPEPFFGLHTPESWSFPSGHSLNSTLCWLVFAAALSPLIGPRYRLAIAIALIVGITRVYLGVHWPTDVLTGWAAGACAAAGLIRASRVLR